MSAKSAYNRHSFVFSMCAEYHRVPQGKDVASMDIKCKIKNAIESQGVDIEKLKDLFSMVYHCEDKNERREWLLYVRAEVRNLLTAEAYELLRKTYVLGAQDGNFDDYCIALEWYRAPEKRFYLPRRTVLKPLVDDLQDLFDGKLDFLGVSLPPRVGKSTLCIIFMTFVMVIDQP